LLPVSLSEWRGKLLLPVLASRAMLLPLLLLMRMSTLQLLLPTAAVQLHSLARQEYMPCAGFGTELARCAGCWLLLL
jgi:hypothetical protein